jgi:hypothetical protein
MTDLGTILAAKAITVSQLTCRPVPLYTTPSRTKTRKAYVARMATDTDLDMSVAKLMSYYIRILISPT